MTNRYTSRLAQPSNRLSYVSTSQLASATYAFRATLEPEDRLQEAQGAKMDQYQSTILYSSVESAYMPNANTSGLPTPRQRQLATMSEHNMQPQSSRGLIPSTVGSALRRRQASPVVPSCKVSSRLPSPSSSATKNLNHSSSFCVRRSQSQKPSNFNIGGSQILRQNNFGAQFRTSSLTQAHRISSTQEQSEFDHDDEASSKDVQLLAPLKSTTYITRLISSDIKESQESKSEPIAPIKSTKTLPSPMQITALTKPSQLVKPLVNKSSLMNKALSSKNDVSKETSSFGLSKVATIKTSTTLVGLPRTKQSLLPTKSRLVFSPTSTNRSHNETRRLSLQTNNYGSKSLVLNVAQQPLLRANTSDNEMVSEDSSSEATEDEEEEETGAEDENDDEEDDSTTAPSLTQMSESNVLSNTNQEFNSMIQMLSSKSILSDTDSSKKLQHSSSNVNRFSTSQQLSKKEQSSTSHLPKVKSKLVKSQSISFGARKIVKQQTTTGDNLEASKISQLSVQLQSSFNSDLVEKTLDSSSNRSSLKTYRPRSRIIFDPTKSQFHVSCTQELQDNYALNDRTNSSSDSSSADANDTTNPLDCESEDEASLKLIDTQNKIVTLKYLPLEGELMSEHNYDPEKKESDTIRRLQDCRGSLESLILNHEHRSTGESMAEPALEKINKKEEESAKQRRSPVGSALRSLFGLQPSETSYDLVSRADANLKCKSGALIRHESLRSNIRPFTAQKLSNAQETTNQVAKHSSFGSELLHKASKKLSASSSSLTNKFKFMSGSQSVESSTLTQTDCKMAEIEQEKYRPGTGSRFRGRQSNKLAPLENVQSATQQSNTGLPPKMPNCEYKQCPTNDISSNCSSVMNGLNNCDQQSSSESSFNENKVGLSNSNGLDFDGDTTLLSDTSTLHGESSNAVYINKCAELERTIESLKNKLITKEKELTELQLKQWSADFLIDKLRSTINKLEKENAHLKALVVQTGRVNLS